MIELSGAAHAAALAVIGDEVKHRFLAWEYKADNRFHICLSRSVSCNPDLWTASTLPTTEDTDL